MKILALNGSPRKKGNTNRILDEMIKGCTEKGHDVEKYFLDKLDINPCSGCEICAKEKTADLKTTEPKSSTNWQMAHV